MINNNTNDVAYLGMSRLKIFIHKMQVMPIDYLSLKYNNPQEEYELINEVRNYHITASTIALFDCNGCRYGFRIKQLKTK